MKKYNIILIIVLIAAIGAHILYNVLNNFAGGYVAKYQYLKITMNNFKQNQFDIALYNSGEKKDYTMPEEYSTNIVDDMGQEIMKKVEDNEIKYYSEYNAIEGVPGRDFVDNIKITIIKNNGDVFEKDFFYEFGKDVYKNYEFDCETGNLIEKDVDETDMPHIRQQAFKKKIDNTIRAVYHTVIAIAVVYVALYIYVLIKNKRK